uniref:Uncharacterized protein n=1 Tax=Arundo donax TaxID=35708 RepID=A0A0A9BEA4_ARUDO
MKHRFRYTGMCLKLSLSAGIIPLCAFSMSHSSFSRTSVHLSSFVS